MASYCDLETMPREKSCLNVMAPDGSRQLMRSGTRVRQLRRATLIQKKQHRSRSKGSVGSRSLLSDASNLLSSPLNSFCGKAALESIPGDQDIAVGIDGCCLALGVLG